MAQQPIELILLRQLASYLAFPIWVMDAEGGLLFYNEPAEEVLGRKFEEAGPVAVEELGMLFQTAREDGSPMGWEELPVAIALQQRRPSHKRVRFKALNGAWRTIEVTAFPIEGQSARHLGAIAIFWEMGDK
jgi:PAS domain-containing protein